MTAVRTLILFLFLSSTLTAQVVYEPIRSSVYNFMDEMANAGYIELNSVAKPYSRQLIARNLEQLDKVRDELNKRQQGELDFYLKDFGKELHADRDFDKRVDLLYRKNENFTLSVNPILGGAGVSNDSGLYYHRWNGAEAFSYFGENLGMYASLRDNHVNKVISDDDMITNQQGGNYKWNSSGGGDWSEMKGGIMASWEWGEAGIVKDDFTWGNNYNGANIFSDRSPSFGYLNLRLYPADWFEMNYIHGWLVSEVLDSARTFLTGTGEREYMMQKFVAANLFTFKPFDKVRLSVGNSVIYDYKLNPVYLIPVMFYKSVDHTYNGAGSNEVGQNSQMFWDLSIRRLKNFHFYASMFIDEVSFSNLWDKNNHSNFFSMKGGFQMSNIIPNVFLTAEYTRTNPWTYRHEQPTTTFASNQFTLGHYLLDNSEEVYLSLGYKPLKNLFIKAYFINARKGPEHQFAVIHGVPNVKGLTWMSSTDWQDRRMGLTVNYEVINSVHATLGLEMSDVSGNVQHSPGYYYGSRNNIRFGLTYGF